MSDRHVSQWEQLLDGTAYASVANFKPLFNLLIALVDSERLLDIECLIRFSIISIHLVGLTDSLQTL